MSLSPGTRLGPYEVLVKLGEGGMGEVYRARDTKLARDVALKFLSTGVDDPSARDRFQREARTIAALNHPNIVTIFAVEEIDVRSFLAMELVEGRTLGDLIPDDGLPIDAVLRYAIPIADALSAAHAQGITHRDLKPSNVMITKDGRVKVLDFGLAKLREDVVQVEDATVGPTRPLTGRGQIVGTVAYMSPEQAQGGAVDHRTDLFSLGVMLYEMASGRRPFAGDGSVGTLASILKDTPKPLTEVRPHLPRDLARIVRRALAKDPEQRYQTAKDLRNDLQTLKDDLTSGDLSVSMPAMAPRPKRSFAVIATVAAAAALVAAAAVYLVVRPRSSPAVRSEETPTITRLTTTGQASLAAISPDGKYVAYVVSENAMHSLWMRQAATASTVQVLRPGADRFIGLTFSPDGDYLYFTRFGGVTRANVDRIPVLGGTPQPVVRNVDSPISFSPDGSQIVFARGYPTTNETSIVVVGTAGGPETRVATRPFMGGGFILGARPAWSPDGRTIAAAVGSTPMTGLLTAARASVVGIDISAHKERPLASAAWDAIKTLTWIADGSLVVSGAQQGRPNDQLWRIFPDGVIRRLTNDLNAYSDVASASKSPALVAVLSDLSSTISTMAPGESALGARLTTGAGRYDGQSGIAWTPDGRLVFTSAVGGQLDLWIADGDGKNARQLTSDAASEANPSVTPDGRSVLFAANRQNQPGIWRLDLASGAAARVTDADRDFYPQCLPDGQTVLFTRFEQEGPRVFKVPIAGGAPARLTTTTDWPLAVSRDGRMLALLTMNPARIGVAPLADLSDMRRFDIVNIPVLIGFSPTGDALTYLESRKGAPALWTQPLAGGDPKPLLDLKGDRIFSFAYARDGRLAVAHGPAPSDVVLMAGIK